MEYNLRKGVFNIKPQKTIWRLLKYSLQFKYGYVILFFTMILGIGLDLGIAWYLSQVTNTAVSNGKVLWQSLVVTGLIILLLNVVNSYVDTYFKTKVSSKIRNNLRVDTLKKLMCLPESYYNDNHSGELLSRMTNDNQAIGNACTDTVISLIRNPLLAVLAFIYLLTIHWQLALICVLIGPMTILVGGLFGKALRNNSQELQSGIGKMTSLLQEILGSSIIFKTFGLEKKLFGKFVSSSNDISQLEIQGGRIHASLSATANAVGHFSFIITFVLGAVFVSNGSMAIGGLIAFIQLMNHLTWPFTGMASLWGGFQQALGAADRIFTLMDEQSEYSSLPKQAVNHEQGYLKVTDLTFGYKEDQYVLNNIGFSVKPGEVVAIVGPSGGGKSTIYKLLLGLFKQNFGHIQINELNTNSMKLEDLRSYFALVPQENYLYSGTVRENIANGKPDATDDEIISAARDANALDFIMELPEGFETEIGEGGDYLSGGQKQRISIARALLRNAPILLLDEATAALDSESERLVQEALDRLMKGRTTIIIAHRLSTIKNANEIIVLDNGGIIDKGTHEELLKSEGLYRKLVNNSLGSNKMVDANV
ncbi:ABC transporter ATP-binding protein [Paenibacillus sp. FSL R5-0744]|uniref:ABC transporter ATP-binding protein n=1 Tax=Paenibacillus sp. FSL R5-0744 TaxID=2921656 RepID=UPI0030DB62A6